LQFPKMQAALSISRTYWFNWWSKAIALAWFA